MGILNGLIMKANPLDSGTDILSLLWLREQYGRGPKPALDAIAEAVHLPPETVRSVCGEMEHEGYVESYHSIDKTGKRYMLTDLGKWVLFRRQRQS